VDVFVVVTFLRINFCTHRGFCVNYSITILTYLIVFHFDSLRVE
jgi:hypothetical protein